jgi:hypothetical protein
VINTDDTDQENQNFTTEDAKEHREARIKRSERQKLTTKNTDDAAEKPRANG